METSIEEQQYCVPDVIVGSNKELFHKVFLKLQNQRTPLLNAKDNALLEFPNLTEPTDKYTKFENFLKQLEIKKLEYHEIQAKSEKVDQSFQNLKKNLACVKDKSTTFYSEIGQHYEKYHSLIKEKELVVQYLQTFENLKYVTKKINTFNMKFLIRRKDQVETLFDKVFESLDFLESHTDFKEYETYRFHFKQQLVKICEMLVKYLSTSFLQNLVKDIDSQISKLKDFENLESARETLLYNKFAMTCEDFSFFQNLILRSYLKYGNTKFYAKDLHKNMEQTYNAYFSMREKLITQSIWLQVDEIVLNDKNQRRSLVKFIQDNILFFTSLFEKELGLFNKFFPLDFPEKSTILNDWFINLCEPFYDSCRIRVIRKSSISLLCDCVTLLNKYYEFEDGSMEYEFQFKDIKYDKIFQPVMNDIQSRLIFKSQLYVESSIINYKPSKTEFQIVGGTFSKLQLKQTPSQSSPSNDSDNQELLVQYIENLKVFQTELSQHYYLPMLRSLALLSKLYQMISSSIFDELAHQIVHEGLESLHKAWQISGKPTLDKVLIYMSNLLFFKDQIQNFDIQYVSTETYIDFSGFTGLWKSLPFKNNTTPQVENRFQNTNSTFSSTISTFANSLVPKVINNMVDARIELVIELKNAVIMFTQICTNLITKDLFENRDTSQSDLIKSVEEETPRLFKEICTYFPNPVTQSQLMEALKDTIITNYSNYYKSVTETETETETAESHLIFPDIFSDMVSKQIDKCLAVGNLLEDSS